MADEDPAVLKDPDYHDELYDSIGKAHKIIFHTETDTYFEDTIDVLAFLLKKGVNIVMITFDTNTRDLVEFLKYVKKVDTSKLRIIDAVSVHLGAGTPPVERIIAISNPANFSDLEVYTYVFLEETNHENPCLFFYGLHKLEEHVNVNEIGVFLRVVG